jgi:hypothetical protein
VVVSRAAHKKTTPGGVALAALVPDFRLFRYRSEGDLLPLSQSTYGGVTCQQKKVLIYSAFRLIAGVLSKNFLDGRTGE